jgi:hypothetical protein
VTSVIMAVVETVHERNEVTGLAQSTHVDDVAGLADAGASCLLDLEGLAVERVDRDAFWSRVVHVVTADETASACPSCGVFSTSVKERVATWPRDIPYGTTPLRLVWHKRRWRCREAACPQTSFPRRSPRCRPGRG